MKPMSVTKHAQTGSSTVMWMLLSIVFGLAVMTMLKLMPVYIEHMSVVSSMNSLRNEASLRGAGPNDLRDALMRRLDINDVDNVKVEHLSIVREVDSYVINVKYDVVLPYISNITLLISFDDTTEVPIR